MTQEEISSSTII